MNKFLMIILLSAITACNNESNKTVTKTEDMTTHQYTKGSFGYDLNFLKQYHKDLVLLGDDSAGARVIILPAYQGRVMTSSAEGYNGASFGWVNHELIASGIIADHINAYGGEERFWLGPEGGQYALFFKKGMEFKFDNWHVPEELDTEPFTLVNSTKHEAAFEKEIHIVNYAGNKFDLLINRTITLLNKSAIDSALGIALPGDVKAVAFQSNNVITNKGTHAWDKKTGMLSIWILSMLNATDLTTVIIPYKQNDAGKPGKIITDDYFGKVPAGRLKVSNGLILFKADAAYRSKIGIAPERALPVAASYDAANNVLTIEQFSLHDGVTDYVNSLWKIQDNPYAGDAVNAYNDGPIDGRQLGKFYELESSSPAAALAPGQSMSHLHRTIHLKGSKESLDIIAVNLFGIKTNDIIMQSLKPR